jgi:hypothetical protein
MAPEGAISSSVLLMLRDKSPPRRTDRGDQSRTPSFERCIAA